VIEEQAGNWVGLHPGLETVYAASSLLLWREKQARPGPLAFPAAWWSG